MLTDPQKARPIDEFDEQASSSWSPLSLIRILWTRKIGVLLTWAILTAGVVGTVKFWPATYRAETLILVDQQKIPEKFVSATVNAELQDRLATLSQEILSSTRLQKIIDRYKLYEKDRKNHVQEEIIEMMRADIKVTAEKGWVQNRPGAFRVSYEGRDPNVVAEVTNQLGSLFIEENLRSRETIAEGTSDFIKTQMSDAKQNLEEQEKKLSEFKTAYNGELPQQEAALAQELSRLQVQLQSSQDAVNRVNQNKVTLESSLSVSQSTEATLKQLIEANKELSKRPPAVVVGPSGAPVKKKSEQLEEQLGILSVKYAPNHPDIQILKLAIQRTKADEAKEEASKAAEAKQKDFAEALNTLDPPSAQALATNADEVKALAAAHERTALITAQLASSNEELTNRQAEQKKILAQMEVVQGRVRRLPLREQELAKVTRDYEVSKANYNSLQDKIFAADMATEMERRQKSERFTVLDPAQVPEKPVRPDRVLLAGAGSAIALALSLGSWLLAGIRRNKFLGEWELPEGVTILGRVPALPTGNELLIERSLAPEI